MLCKSLCAFREPFGDRFVEAIYPGQDVEVPDTLVDRLVADRHIERPMMTATAAVEEGSAGAAAAADDAGADHARQPRARRRRSE